MILSTQISKAQETHKCKVVFLFFKYVLGVKNIPTPNDQINTIQIDSVNQFEYDCPNKAVVVLRQQGATANRISKLCGNIHSDSSNAMKTIIDNLDITMKGKKDLSGLLKYKDDGPNTKNECSSVEDTVEKALLNGNPQDQRNMHYTQLLGVVVHELVPSESILIENPGKNDLDIQINLEIRGDCSLITNLYIKSDLINFIIQYKEKNIKKHKSCIFILCVPSSITKVLLDPSLGTLWKDERLNIVTRGSVDGILYSFNRQLIFITYDEYDMHFSQLNFDVAQPTVGCNMDALITRNFKNDIKNTNTIIPGYTIPYAYGIITHLELSEIRVTSLGYFTALKVLILKKLVTEYKKDIRFPEYITTINIENVENHDDIETAGFYPVLKLQDCWLLTSINIKTALKIDIGSLTRIKTMNLKMFDCEHFDNHKTYILDYCSLEVFKHNWNFTFCTKMECKGNNSGLELENEIFCQTNIQTMSTINFECKCIDDSSNQISYIPSKDLLAKMTSLKWHYQNSYLPDIFKDLSEFESLHEIFIFSWSFMTDPQFFFTLHHVICNINMTKPFKIMFKHKGSNLLGNDGFVNVWCPARSFLYDNGISYYITPSYPQPNATPGTG